MNALHLPFAGLNRPLVLAGICCLFFASAPKGLADPDTSGAETVTAAKAWLALIDAGRYDEGYAVGCDAFHNKLTQDKWVLILKTLRTPLGNVLSRKLVDHNYKPNGVNGLDGECIVLTFDTSFAKAESDTETVVLKHEGVKWLGAGYSWGPKEIPGAPTNEESPTTTTTTQSTKTPPDSLPQ